ncbi:hypothetical protein E2C01_021761 [Portunus trituberculatus]|uniref:Uncharacterized protein n=1 Tax=Portunus trituberculatus TaxID=210409 RepID=A0A5B7E3F1_PORTR|nr:hypothetical protein [Portunus trituberculatus]
MRSACWHLSIARGRLVSRAEEKVRVLGERRLLDQLLDNSSSGVKISRATLLSVLCNKRVATTVKTAAGGASCCSCRCS